VIFKCCDERRKAAVLGNPTLNGIDFLEVLDLDAIPLNSPRQRTLLVHCLKLVPPNLTPSNVLIIGGESITNIVIQWIAPASAPPPLGTPQENAFFTALADAPNTLVIRTEETGDFSPYALRLVNDAAQAKEDPFAVTEVLAGFDPQLAEVRFSFKVECPSDLDCAPPKPFCPPDALTPPPINYLAKDYGSFRTVILDRLAQLVPAWGGSSEADLGIALAELIAYVGDMLSYKQDAIATESYLRTARSRISLRRHALLVDYHIHDGCNARTWMHLNVTAPLFLDRTKTKFYILAPRMPDKVALHLREALLDGIVFFEPMQNARLFPEHNRMSFYTWGDSDCCLPKGATAATLRGTLPNLQIGDVLIFQEMKGPQTGNPADADVRHRWAVRLTNVTTQNALGEVLVDPLYENGTGKPITSPGQKPTPVTEIQWSAEDALPFPVCVSSKFLDSKNESVTLTDVSVVLGNNVLADHGLSVSDLPLPTVPPPTIFYPPDPAGDRCKSTRPVPLPVRYRPELPAADRPLTQTVRLPLAGSPITASIVHLLPNSSVSLNDTNGFVSLMVRPAAPLSWPALFGLVAKPNAVTPGNFDLSLVYNPPVGAPGISGTPILETLSNLSINPADPNFVAKRINPSSKFVRVPASYVPPATAPATFPTPPTMLAASGMTDLHDTGGNTYLTLQPTNPAGWPPAFGVLAQGKQQTPNLFNLLVVYAPASGVGVPVPIVVEEFNDVSLANIAALVATGSHLIQIRSFEEEPNAGFSAFALMHYDANTATPEITLTGQLNSVRTTWTPEPDLLADSPTDRHFVVEIESDGRSRLRFGDDVNGLRPQSGTRFTAAYRIGNGASGNIGADSLTFFIGDQLIQSCTNPLPASGGTDPETNEQIRRRAPQAFMTQERAITMPDYVRVAEMNAQVKDAVATLRWTGSWYTVFITAEPKGAGQLTPALRRELACNINRYRLAGQDIELENPQYVSLDLELTVCVDPAYFRSDVEQGLLEVLGCQLLPDGRKGFFFPDNFTFGQAVYLSPIYAAARKVAGVTSVRATLFEPQGVSTPIYQQIGKIRLGPFQIARLENDPSLPDHGKLSLVLEGGK
jgi:Baseplate J-like protein